MKDVLGSYAYVIDIHIEQKDIYSIYIQKNNFAEYLKILLDMKIVLLNY